MTSNEELFDELIGSAFLRADDLDANIPIKRRIVKAEVSEPMRQSDGEMKRKFIVTFAGLDKVLPLNKSNARALAKAYGKDYAKWSGGMVEIAVKDTDRGPGISLAPIVNGKAAAAGDADTLNDDVPF
jgi:hypothetical protein